jgi:hypothetical protein
MLSQDTRPGQAGEEDRTGNAHLAFAEPLSRFVIWLAVATWVAVAGAFVIRRVRG